MASQITWCVEGRVLYINQSGLITLNILEMTMRFITHEIDRLNSPLRFKTHVIFDVDGVKNSLNNLMPLTGVIGDYYSRPQLGWTLVVTTNHLHRVITSVTVNLMRARSRTFANNTDALTFLQQIDQTLPPLPPTIPAQEPIAVFE